MEKFTNTNKWNPEPGKDPVDPCAPNKQFTSSLKNATFGETPYADADSVNPKESEKGESKADESKEQGY